MGLVSGFTAGLHRGVLGALGGALAGFLIVHVVVIVVWTTQDVIKTLFDARKHKISLTFWTKAVPIPRTEHPSRDQQSRV
jgi:hypothetical protein